jgi:hypothetical protein
VSSRLEIRFRDGYAPPADEVKRVLQRVDDELRLERSGRQPVSKELGDRILELDATGLTRDDISETLRAEGWPLPSRGSWRAATVTTTLKRVCAERGLEYVRPSPRRRSRNLDEASLELMCDMFRRTRSWKQTALELNRLGSRQPEGHEWTGRSLQIRLRYYAHRVGLGVLHARDKPPNPRSGRPRYLDPTTRDAIWRRHRIDGHSLAEVGRWLTKVGIRNASGGARWSKSSVLHVVRSVDAELRPSGRETDEAA